MPATPPRKAAVLGSPIAHSLSPALHGAAYAALGLAGWTYERIECDAEALPGLVAGLGPEWVGLSVTMPGKSAALAFADERTARAELVGSANTLVRTERGWRADSTDIDGVIGALGELGFTGPGALAGGTPVLLGAGGTARPALAGLAALGAREVVIVARDAGRAASTVDCAQRAGLTPQLIDFTPAPLREAVAAAPAVVSTLPAEAAAPHTENLAGARALLDVIYHPWPTPLAEAVTAAGGAVIGGRAMLLHQAFGQVEQFTGRSAPRAEMAAALPD